MRFIGNSVGAYYFGPLCTRNIPYMLNVGACTFKCTCWFTFVFCSCISRLLQLLFINYSWFWW